MKIHNPTSFGLPSSWAYEQGYLQRRGNLPKKNKKRECQHGVTYFDITLGGFVCQFCKKYIGELEKGQDAKSE